MKSVIAIGDVHGCFNTLMKLIEQFPKDVPLAFCGDLQDRGPRSMQVIDFVKNNNHACAKGNHEDLMVRADYEYETSALWSMNGGDNTLVSYLKEDGKLDRDKLAEHRKWMKDLPLYIEFKDAKNDKGKYLVVSHSSIGKVWKWNEEKRKDHHDQFENVVMWGRLPPESAKGIYNIFGHTPHPVMDIRIKSFYANVDTGCCYGSEQHKLQGYGVLTALQFPEMKIFQQENID